MSQSGSLAVMSTAKEELVITAEMIEAAAAELAAYDPRTESSDGAVVDIFLAMIRA